MGALILLVLFVIAIWCALGTVGAWLATQRRRSPGIGFAFGFLFGPIGLVIVALLPYGPQPPAFPTHTRTTANRPLYVSPPTSPTQPPRLSEKQWRALEPAAAYLPAPLREQTQALAAGAQREHGRNQGLRASLFVRNKSGSVLLELLFDNKILTLTPSQRNNGLNTSYIHAALYETGDPLPIVVRHRTAAEGYELSFDSRANARNPDAASWVEILSNEDDFNRFCTEAKSRHWIHFVAPNTTSSSPLASLRAATSSPPFPHPSQPVAAVSQGRGMHRPAHTSSTVPAAQGLDLNTVRAKLAALKDLWDRQLISEEEYRERKGAILDSIL